MFKKIGATEQLATAVPMLLGLPISTGESVDSLLLLAEKALDDGSSAFITFINPNSYWIEKKSPSYRQHLSCFDVVLADGIGVVAAARLLNHWPIERISFDGTSLAPPVFDLCSRLDVQVFLVGGAEGVAQVAATAIQESWPSIKIVGLCQGYFERPDEVIEKIRNSGARLVLCGMGSPNQEEFLISLKSSGWRGVAFTCGGFLDQLTQGVQYYPQWVNSLNLRFAYRLYREPARLWRRYLVQYQYFIGLLLRDLLAPTGFRLTMANKRNRNHDGDH